MSGEELANHRYDRFMRNVMEELRPLVIGGFSC